MTQRNVETTKQDEIAKGTTKRSKEVTQRNDETTKRKHETTTQTFCPGFDFIQSRKQFTSVDSSIVKGPIRLRDSRGQNLAAVYELL